jgi:hypothetical protein
MLGKKGLHNVKIYRMGNPVPEQRNHEPLSPLSHGLLGSALRLELPALFFFITCLGRAYSLFLSYRDGPPWDCRIVWSPLGISDGVRGRLVFPQDAGRLL